MKWNLWIVFEITQTSAHNLLVKLHRGTTQIRTFFFFKYMTKHFNINDQVMWRSGLNSFSSYKEKLYMICNTIQSSIISAWWQKPLSVSSSWKRDPLSPWVESWLGLEVGRRRLEMSAELYPSHHPVRCDNKIYKVTYVCFTFEGFSVSGYFITKKH